ncbi:hypothetical protein [uncultured Roseibium sp.]|nr:hypothetical protein [uncultured Roseibium sp.]
MKHITLIFCGSPIPARASLGRDDSGCFSSHGNPVVIPAQAGIQ